MLIIAVLLSAVAFWVSNTMRNGQYISCKPTSFGQRSPLTPIGHKGGNWGDVFLRLSIFILTWLGIFFFWTSVNTPETSTEDEIGWSFALMFANIVGYFLLLVAQVVITCFCKAPAHPSHAYPWAASGRVPVTSAPVPAGNVQGALAY